MSQTSAIPVPAVAQPAREKRWFFRGMAVAAALTVFVGFARTYYLKDVFAGPPLTPLQHLHGFVFTAWILFFLVQTWLVASQRTPLHRRLGVAGGVLAVLMVVVGVAASMAMVPEPQFSDASRSDTGSSLAISTRIRLSSIRSGCVEEVQATRCGPRMSPTACSITR